MHQSGHSREHSMQTVQFSSLNAITPRVRGGRSGITCGYCCVTARRVMVFIVTLKPLTRPKAGPINGLEAIFFSMARMRSSISSFVRGIGTARTPP